MISYTLPSWQWGSVYSSIEMINSLGLLGRIERLFVSGLRKNIVALLVQCAVVGGVTLQGAQTAMRHAQAK